jgi:hypothetical protein
VLQLGDGDRDVDGHANRGGSILGSCEQGLPAARDAPMTKSALRRRDVYDADTPTATRLIAIRAAPRALCKSSRFQGTRVQDLLEIVEHQQCGLISTHDAKALR